MRHSVCSVALVLALCISVSLTVGYQVGKFYGFENCQVAQ
jgi:hypothetical protein